MMVKNKQTSIFLMMNGGDILLNQYYYKSVSLKSQSKVRLICSNYSMYLSFNQKRIKQALANENTIPNVSDYESTPIKFCSHIYRNLYAESRRKSNPFKRRT